ncbi:hypothetical protein [Kribbella sp. NBC_00359]|uniref:hypothetical protein n=1 Tax=Kribbella sp. NBC_00359 TaxID=2975966 RepID=UPI003FA52B46
MFANPFFGKMSDRTSSKLGMRRPRMVIGLVVGSLGVLVVALAPNIPVVLLGWCRRPRASCRRAAGQGQRCQGSRLVQHRGRASVFHRAGDRAGHPGDQQRQLRRALRDRRALRHHRSIRHPAGEGCSLSAHVDEAAGPLVGPAAFSTLRRRPRGRRAGLPLRGWHL